MKIIQINELSIQFGRRNKKTAVWILNICVVSLSSLGLISTFVLLYGLANVMTIKLVYLSTHQQTTTTRFNQRFRFQDRRQFLVPWIVIVTCTTAVDFIYAVYLLIHVV